MPFILTCFTQLDHWNIFLIFLKKEVYYSQITFLSTCLKKSMKYASMYFCSECCSIEQNMAVSPLLFNIAKELEKEFFLRPLSV